MDEISIVALAAAVGVAQAVIGAVRKFGLTGNALLAVSCIVTALLALLVRYAWGIEWLRIVVQSVLATLAAAGYWRYRRGDEPPFTPADEESTTA